MLQLMGRPTRARCFPRCWPRQLAPCLGTIQAQPIGLGRPRPPKASASTARRCRSSRRWRSRRRSPAPRGRSPNLQPLRDQTLTSSTTSTRTGDAGAEGVHRLAGHVAKQVRNIDQDLLDLADVDHGQQRRVADHRGVRADPDEGHAGDRRPHPVRRRQPPDPALATETAQTVTGVAAIASLMPQLARAGLSDQVTFVSLNVFGRTSAPATDGRTAQPEPPGLDRHRQAVPRAASSAASRRWARTTARIAIDSKTGQGRAPRETSAGRDAASFGKTVLAAVGVDPPR